MKKIIQKAALCTVLAGMLMAQPAAAMFNIKTLNIVAPLVGVVGTFLFVDMLLDWYGHPSPKNTSDERVKTEEIVMELEETFEELPDNKDVLKKNEIFCTDVYSDNFKLTLFGKVDNKIVAVLSINSNDMGALDTNYTIEIHGLSAQYVKSLVDAFSTIYVVNPGVQLTVIPQEDISEKFANKNPHDFVACMFSVSASKMV